MPKIISFKDKHNRTRAKADRSNTDAAVALPQDQNFHLRVGESEIRITQAGNIELRNAHASFVMTADGKLLLNGNRMEMHAKEEFNCQAEVIRLN